MGYVELSSRRAARRLYVVVGTLLAVISILNSSLIAISINNLRLAFQQ
jgi:hypothetical protein